MRTLFRSITAGGLLLICSGVQAITLAYEPVGLEWTAAEVQRAGREAIEAVLDRADRQHRRGCQAHCLQIERVYAALLTQARLQSPLARQLPWSLTVVRLDDVAAFAAPDGALVVSEGLITEHGLSDAALAFVLAHEMAHSILEHERQALSFARMLLPREVPRSVPDMYVEMSFNRALLKSMEPVLQQGEFEADELGFLLAASAGFAPNRQLEFMQGEVAEDTGERPWVATHPVPMERLLRLQERLPLAWRLFDHRR